MLNRSNSEKLFKKARTLFPGGVNSPVRAFKAVDGTPLFIEKGSGSTITDEDGNEYIDYCCSWGPLILGHNNDTVREYVIETLSKGTSFGAPTRKENDLAELIIENHRFVDKIRFVSSGTEAVMSALRLARGYTGKNKIIKFEGCYHGHVDSLLVKAGSGLVTLGESDSAGVPEGFAAETIVLPLNDPEAVRAAFDRAGADVAAVIIEPVPANNGLLLQDKSFLQLLRELCTANESLLIFDEVISGFRIGFEGASGYYNIEPDLLTFGKIIGGGLPVGAYGGKAEVMAKVSPEGPVYQAGTLSGNPVAMAAGYAQLKECLKDDFYNDLRAKTEHLTTSVQAYADAKNYKFRIFSLESIFWLAFNDSKTVRRSDEIDPAGMSKFKKLHGSLLESGVYLGPSGYEVGFVSEAHSDEDITRSILAFHKALDAAYESDES